MIKKLLLLTLFIISGCYSNKKDYITEYGGRKIKIKDNNIINYLKKKLGQDTIPLEITTGFYIDGVGKNIGFITNEYGNIVGISITGHGIETIPKEVCDLDSLESIFISKGNIKDINNLKLSSTVKRLFIVNSKISGEILLGNQFSQLEKLVLRNNNITNIKFDKKVNYSLKVLFLNSNKLSHLDASINNLQELEKLYLSNNNIKSLNGVELPQLSIISLDNNPIKDSLEIRKQLPKKCMVEF